MFKIVIKWTDSQSRPSKRSRIPERLVAGSLVWRLHDNCLSSCIPDRNPVLKWLKIKCYFITHVVKHRAAGSLKELHLPESSRTTLPPFMIFPMTTSERNSTFRSRLNQDFNGGIPSKSLGGSEQDKITSICPSWTWSSSGRTPAPCPEMKAIEICSYYSLGMKMLFHFNQKPGIEIHIHKDLCNFGKISSRLSVQGVFYRSALKMTK